MDADLKDYCGFASRLADAARKETLPRFRAGAQIFNKAGIWFDPVTDADREAERALIRMIKAVYPRTGIIGEEFGKHNPEARDIWVLDPVDGTRAFICGGTSWTTLIALERDQVPVIGVIDQPFTDERWIGTPDGTRYRHGETEKDVRTSGLETLAKARISTTDPRRQGYFTAAEEAAFRVLDEKSRVARFSLDGYAYALLAIGQLDLVVESGLNHYDYAALAPVVRGAGGVITDWQGNMPGTDESGRIIAAASPALHEQALAILRAVA